MLRAEARSPRDGEMGFTLLEVLVAFLIFAISMGAVFGVFSSAAATVERVRAERTAAQIAQSQLARVGQDIPLQPGFHQGGASNGFTWTLVVEPYRETPVGHLRLVTAFRVAVEVTREPRHLSIATVRLGPREAAP